MQSSENLKRKIIDKNYQTTHQSAPVLSKYKPNKSEKK